MAAPLKEMFNLKFYQQLGGELSKADRHFHADAFVKEVTAGLDERSLIERMRNTSVVLKKHVPADYKKTIELFTEIIPAYTSSFTSLIFPDFVGQYGHTHFDLSMEALKHFTKYGSSEFAVREFLKRDFNKTIKVMNTWAADENHHVRRLASEGSRPRLPWSFHLQEVIKNPEVTRPILEKLKADDELYVKKSVANHLNDFSKHHAAYMLDVINSWDKTNEHTAWIIKHASRTLIKKGHPSTLSVFNFEKNVKIKVSDFRLNTSTIRLGDTLVFDFTIESQKKTAQKLVIDYAIGYVKKSGEISPKIFKLKETDLQPRQTACITKAQRFIDFSTRKHFAGKHFIELLINGKPYLKKGFRVQL